MRVKFTPLLTRSKKTNVAKGFNLIGSFRPKQLAGHHQSFWPVDRHLTIANARGVHGHLICYFITRECTSS